MYRTVIPLALLAACAQPASRAAHPRSVHVASAPALSVPPPDEHVASSFVGEDEGEDEYSEPNHRTEPATEGDACGVADVNIERDAESILHAARPSGPPTARAAWDRATPPAMLDRVTRRYGLLPAERAMLFRQGFVVPERLAAGTYAVGFHEIYQSQLPLYVSVDAILHAIFRTNDAIIADLESHRLAPMLARVIDAAHAELPAAARHYPPDVARDLDVYLAVARSLLADAPVPTRLGTEADAAAVTDLVQRARDANALSGVALFGRDRMVDFSQYTPRGHYATRAALAPYFRAAMWLSRLEFNLVSRSSRSSAPGAPDPRETPREATAALALADLLTRAGVMSDVAALDHAWGVFAGRREDVTVHQLAALRAHAGIAALTAPDVAARLRAAIGTQFQRTTRTHYMPEGSAVLPAITTLLGPRIVPDATMLLPLVHSAMPDRHDVHAADVAYALGHDRARHYLAAEIAQRPDLPAGLDAARRIAQAPVAGNDLYGAWYTAVRALAARPEGALPSYMDTDAFADLRVNSTVAAFGQLRHNYVLMAAQTYSEAGCEIPDGYVEPAPALYDALIEYAARGAAVMRELSPGGDALEHEVSYFVRLGQRLRVLRAIVDDELANRPLSAEARRFLSMVVEIAQDPEEETPSFTGWYFDLFRRRVNEGMGEADFIADYYTSAQTGQVAYAGARSPVMGLFVVDTGGPPRVVVGPVARAYEWHAPLAHRLTDEDARALRAVESPWAASYTVPAPRPPPLVVEARGATGREPEGTARLSLRSTRALGRARIELVDHHGVVLHTLTRAIGTGATVVTLPAGYFHPSRPVEGARVVVGAYRGELGVPYGLLVVGGMRPPPVPHSEETSEESEAP